MSRTLPLTASPDKWRVRVYRIGLVGTGGVANIHFKGYKEILNERAIVTAGCDPNPSALAAFCDGRNIPHRFSDPGSLINSGEVDILVLLTPPAVRAEYIYPALEKGLHVLVEKPFGNTYKECLGYVEAARKSNARLAVSQNLRFYPDIEWAQEKVAAGELGKINYIASDHYQWRMQTGGWRKDEQRLEIAIFSIHILDRMRWVAGLIPKTISALTRSSWLPDSPRGEIFTDLRIEFEGGCIGHMTSSWYSRIQESRLRVDGTLGSLTTTRPDAVHDKAQGVIEVEGKGMERHDFNRARAVDKAFGYSLKHLIDAIDEGREPIHSGQDNLQTMTIVDGAYLSAERGGKPVTAEEIHQIK